MSDLGVEEMQVGMFFYVFSLSFASSSREDYTKSSSFGVL
jgi:hypothetical protein